MSEGYICTTSGLPITWDINKTMKNKSIVFDEFRLVWETVVGDKNSFKIVDLDGNPYKISGSSTFNCDCPISQLMTKGCSCGGS